MLLELSDICFFNCEVQHLIQYFTLHLIQPESNQIKKLQQASPAPCKEQQR